MSDTEGTELDLATAAAGDPPPMPAAAPRKVSLGEMLRVVNWLWSDIENGQNALVKAGLLAAPHPPAMERVFVLSRLSNLLVLLEINEHEVRKVLTDRRRH